MSLKPQAKPWTVMEQFVEDPVSGLTFQFEVVEGTSAGYRLRVCGNQIPFGNRELLFNEAGVYAGSGCFAGGLARPSWSEQSDL